MNDQGQITTSASGDGRGGPEIPITGLVPASLLEVVWRNRWIVLACIVLALVGGFIYVLKATPIFLSTSRVYVEQTGPKIIENVQGVMTQSKNYLYTQAELMKSTPVLSMVIDKPEMNRLRTFQDVTNKVVYLKHAIDVSVGKKDDILSVGIESPYPAEAAQIVNNVVDAYITYNSTTKKSTAAEILKILQKQKDKAVIELEEKRKSMLEFQTQNPSITFETSQGNIIIERLAKLSESLTAAELRTVQAKSVYESVKLLVGDPEKLMQFIDAQGAKNPYGSVNVESARLTAELTQLRMQIDDRKKQVTQDHPAIAALQQKYDSLQEQLALKNKQYAEAQLAVAKQDYESAAESEKQIRSYFDEQRKQALDLNQQVTQYMVFKSDVARAENLLTILDDRIKEINVTEDTGALNISILEVARAGEVPVKPQKARTLAMMLVLGIMAGGGLAMLRDWMDRRLRSADEITAVLGIPVLGTVPSMSKRQTISERGMIVHKETASLAAEAYRTIRTAVFFGVPDGKAKVILVTSPLPGDGKTTLVSNMAIAMAQADQKTLVIDADFRKPMQHNIFSLKADHGLSAVIAGRSRLEDCIHDPGVPNLSVMPAGPEIPNPSEMLNSKAFAEVLGRLKQRYDRVIIDSPPVMPVTDARILAALCDVTVVVLRAEQSTRNAAMQARDGLLSVGANLLGAIVNDVSKRNGHYGYYSNYGYSYYGRHKAEDGADRSQASAGAVGTK